MGELNEMKGPKSVRHTKTVARHAILWSIFAAVERKCIQEQFSNAHFLSIVSDG